jgi:hypothetical protein
MSADASPSTPPRPYARDAVAERLAVTRTVSAAARARSREARARSRARTARAQELQKRLAEAFARFEEQRATSAAMLAEDGAAPGSPPG